MRSNYHTHSRLMRVFFTYGIQHIDSENNDPDIQILSEEIKTFPDNSIIVKLTNMLESTAVKDWWRMFCIINYATNKNIDIPSQERKIWWKILRNIVLTPNVEYIPNSKLRVMMCTFPKKDWFIEMKKICLLTDDMWWCYIYAYINTTIKDEEQLKIKKSVFNIIRAKFNEKPKYDICF